MKNILCVLLCLLLCAAPFIPVCAASATDAPLLDGAKLVTFGDSITALSTWPYAVAKGANMDLYNEGIGGNTSLQGAARFERDVLAHDPDFVILSFGTNDFYLEDGVNPRVSIADYQATLTGFIDQIRAIGGVPFLLTPPFLDAEALGGPAYYPEGSVNLALDKYVNAMRDVAHRTGAHLIDIHAACDNGGYNPKTFLISDGIHLADQGNQVYTDTILAYLKANFRQDPSAPRVTTNDPAPLQDGAWTRSVISHDNDDWLVLFPGTMYVDQNEDNSLTFTNNTGAWPEVHYSPRVCETFYAPVDSTYVTLDLELDAAANIYFHFNGPTPTCEYRYTGFALAPVIRDLFPSIATSGYDICGGQDIRCTFPLSALVPDDYIAADGTVLFSGVKMFVSGVLGSTVTINEMSVTATNGTLPTTYYTDADSILPTSTAVITQNEGIVDYRINTDGSLTLARAAESTLAWPSVKIACGKTIDLHKTPYLHLSMTTNGGEGNGFLNYTDAHGNKKSIQLSKLVNGTSNDLKTATDAVVDLASALGTGGTITLDYFTLSVYGVPGAAITLHTLSTATGAVYADGDVDTNGTITAMDVRAVLLHVIKAETLYGHALTIADYNRDGIINTTDARAILLTVAEQI